MKKLSLKTALLTISIAVTMSLTACGSDSSSKKETPTQVKSVNYTQQIADIAKLQAGFDSGAATTEYAKIKSNVAANAQDEIGTWINNYTAAKNSGANAMNGTAGVLKYTKDGAEKVRILNANGFEINQMIKKGLIGAYQLNNAQKEYASIGTKDNQAILEGVTSVLLGSYAELAKGCTDNKDECKYAGNELKKYLIKYPAFTNGVYQSLKYAEANKTTEVMFEASIKSAVRAAEYAVAKRAIHYFEEGTTELADETKFASAVHSISEGLGLFYSLQYGDKYTEADVDGFLDNVNLYNKADAITRLKAQSTDIQTKYGITYEAKAK